MFSQAVNWPDLCLGHPALSRARQILDCLKCLVCGQTSTQAALQSDNRTDMGWQYQYSHRTLHCKHMLAPSPAALFTQQHILMLVSVNVYSVHICSICDILHTRMSIVQLPKTAAGPGTHVPGPEHTHIPCCCVVKLVSKISRAGETHRVWAVLTLGRHIVETQFRIPPPLNLSQCGDMQDPTSESLGAPQGFLRDCLIPKGFLLK